MAPTDHLRWKLEAPGPVPARVHLIEVDDRLAAIGVYLPRVYRVFGRTYNVMDGVDAAVHPDYQGQGLYSLRREAKAEAADPDYDFTVGFSTNQRVMTYRRRRGRGDLPSRPQILVRINSVWRTAARAARSDRGRWLAPLVPGALFALRAWSTLRYRRRPVGCTWQLTMVDRFDARVNELFNAAADGFDFVQERSVDVLNWRYADPRGGDYTIMLAEEGGHLLGYTVFRRSERQGFVMDLLATAGRTDVAASLLDAATGALSDCDAVTCWVAPGHPYEATARARGYVNLRQDSGMTVRAISVGDELFEPLRSATGRVHVMLGDSDHV